MHVELLCNTAHAIILVQFAGLQENTAQLTHRTSVHAKCALYTDAYVVVLNLKHGWYPGQACQASTSQARHSRQSTTSKKRIDLVSLGGKLVLHGDHLHEVDTILAPILKKSNGGIQSQVSKATLIQQADTHVLDVPCSHPVVDLHSITGKHYKQQQQQGL